jgi:hypothetical protein
VRILCACNYIGNAYRFLFKMWYAIDFKWMGSSWKYRTFDDMPGNMLITGVDGEQVVLTWYNPLSLEKP